MCVFCERLRIAHILQEDPSLLEQMLGEAKRCDVRGSFVCGRGDPQKTFDSTQIHEGRRGKPVEFQEKIRLCLKDFRLCGLLFFTLLFSFYWGRFSSGFSLPPDISVGEFAHRAR